MKKEYLNLSLEELIENREFVGWVLRGKNHKQWEAFVAENPDFKAVTAKARKIVELLRDSHEPMSEEDVLVLWKNIDQFDNQFKAQKYRRNFRSVLKYAAIFIIALTTGATGFYLLTLNQNEYVFSTSVSSDHQSQLLLSNGTTVELDKQNSKITLSSDQQITIDNDKTIDLSQIPATDPSKMNEVVIPFGKKSQLILEDGTKVWLNAGSRMAFPTKFGNKKREVFLEGEAYFEVAHNKNLPFWVNTSDISVKVLGTRFNLSAYPSDPLTETILVEGKVAVTERSAIGFLGSETILSPSQKASFSKENKTISVANEPDVEFAIAWTEGWFKFSQQSLNDVLHKLERYYNVQFVFDRSFSVDDLITGKLDLKESIDQVMIALSDVADIEFRINGNQIRIGEKLNQIQLRK